MTQTDSYQREGRRRITMERRRRDESKSIHEGPMDMDNGVGMDHGSGGGLGRGG